MKIDIERFNEMVLELSSIIHKRGKIYSGIYGIPKNGVFVAYKLSEYMNIPVVDASLSNNVLIVDDICESGATLAPFKNCDTAVLFNKGKQKTTYAVDTKTKEWIDFWFEKETDIKENVRRIIEYIGDDAGREGLRETPDRVHRSWSKLFEGYSVDPLQFVKTFENAKYQQMVLLRNIELYSTCEHHMLPFIGKCHIAYIPDKKVIGISKLARIMEVFARRLQIQERLTEEIADFLYVHLKPKGVAVQIEAQHLCMRARGVNKQNSVMQTTALRGSMLNSEKARNEFLAGIKDDTI